MLSTQRNHDCMRKGLYFFLFLTHLTYSNLKLPLKLVIGICDTFDNNLGIKNYFTNYLKESCWQCCE